MKKVVVANSRNNFRYSLLVSFLFVAILSVICFAAPAATSPAGESNSSGQGITEPVAVSPQTESELVIEQGKKANPVESPWARMLLGACVLVGMLAVAYISLKKMSQKSKQGDNQFQLKTLARHYLGPKKYLAVVKVAGETMLIGVTDHHIALVKSPVFWMKIFKMTHLMI